jgi:hypothetical protein
MAENESLDVSNRRFRWIVADLLRGLPPTEVAQRLVKKLCCVWNYVRMHGFNVAEVVGLATTGNDLTAAIRETGGSDLAHLIKLHAHPMYLPGTILDSVNRAAIEQVIDSGLQQAICYKNGPTVLEASRVKQQIMAVAEPVLSSLTDSLLGTSLRVRAPKVLPMATSMPALSIRMPATMLGQSLLPPAQRVAQGVSS